MPQEHTFPTDAPVTVDLRNAAGTIEVTAGGPGPATVRVSALDDGAEAARLADERARVTWTADGPHLIVEVPARRKVLGNPPRIAVQVSVPADSSVSTRTGSATVTCAGRLAGLRAHTDSGAVRAEEVTGDARVHTNGAPVRLGPVGSVGVHTASGDVRVDRVRGDATVHTAGGTIDLGPIGGSVRAHSASGPITVAEVDSGTADLTAASGDVRVGVHRGTVARLDLYSRNGRIGTDLPVEPDEPEGGSAVRIRVRTTSGAIWVGSTASVGAPVSTA